MPTLGTLIAVDVVVYPVCQVGYRAREFETFPAYGQTGYYRAWPDECCGHPVDLALLDSIGQEPKTFGGVEQVRIRFEVRFIRSLV